VIGVTTALLGIATSLHRSHHLMAVVGVAASP
jgi:hypothetical protein